MNGCVSIKQDIGMCGDPEIVITSVFDNWASQEGLDTAWGFATVIEGIDDGLILFDTGSEGLKLLANMQKMGFDVQRINHVVISHEHWDHIGGLDVLLGENPDITVHIPYTFSPGLKRTIRMRASKVVEVKDPVQIVPGLFTTGVLNGSIPEQSVIVSTKSGGALITGCAHPGVVKILEAARKLVPSVHTVLGGFHLEHARPDEISGIINAFHDAAIHFAGPCHCSGNRTRNMFMDAYEQNYLDVRVGSRIPLT